MSLTIPIQAIELTPVINDFLLNLMAGLRIDCLHLFAQKIYPKDLPALPPAVF